MSIWNQIFAKAGEFFKTSDASKSENKNLVLSNQSLDLDFASSIIALAAKMAKADGITTKEEAQAFRAAFPVPHKDEPIVDKLFVMAGGSVLGFEGYAKKIARKFPNNRAIKMDILAILFLVAAADGQIKQVETEFLKSVSTNLGLTESDYFRVSGLFIREENPNPYLILGVHETNSDKEIKAAWLKIVMANHPDNYMARGEPKEFIKAANEQTALANAAYKQICEERRQKATLS